MIAWYVDAGIFESDSPPTNINDITFVDIGRPWGFINANVENGTVYSGTEQSACYSSLKNIIGDDVDRLYCCISSPMAYSERTQYKTLIETFPSIPLAFPNIIQLKNERNIQYVYLRFPSLKKLVRVPYGNTTNRTPIWGYDDSGNLTLLTTATFVPSLRFGTYESNNNVSNGVSFFTVGIIENYTDGSSLLNANNLTKYMYSYFRTSRDQINSISVTIAEEENIELRQEAYEILFGSTPKPDIVDGDIVNPYEPIEPSQPSQGSGTFDDTSDVVPDSSKPSLSSTNTGFTRIYNPTLAQVQSLAQYLWTDTSVIDTIWNHIKQYFEDPMQAIIGFNLVPVPVPDGGTQEFKLMYIGTGVNMTVAASQFVDVDCGTYTVEKYYGSALDYSPYTKISCFLPFIGNVDLNPDEVMGATLQITYRVDICSGSCVAKILVDGNCLYQYSGHCAIPIPLASADFSSYVSAAVSVAKLAIGAAVAGAAGAAAGAAMEAGQATGQIVETTQIVNTARNPQSGRQITTGTQTVTVSRPQPEPRNQTQASFAGLSPANVANTVGEVMSSKPIFQHSGSFSGNTGYLGVRRPYLIITRPNLCMPANFQKLNGYPCMMTLKLGDCTGYTRVQQVQLTGLWATNPEQAEILQLLKSGVIL